MNVRRLWRFRSRTTPACATVAGYPALDIGRLGRRDLAWRTVPVDKVVSAITPPSAGRIRARLADWIAAYPDDHRIRLLDTETGATGRVPAEQRDEYLRALVVHSDEPCPAVGSEPADLGGLPFRLTVGLDWARLRHSHAFGDGASTWQFLGMLLTDDDSVAPGMWAPLCVALLAVLPRIVSALAAQRATRRRRTDKPQATEQQLGSGSALSPDERHGADDRLAPGPHPENESGHTFATSCAVSSADFAGLVRAVRSERESTASTMAIMTLRALLLCRHYGLEMDDRVTFMVDLRRYLPGSGAVDGNFSWSKSVPVTGSDTPAQLGARISRVVGTGLPLFAYAADVLRRSLFRADGMTQAPAPAGRSVRLMMSYATRWPATPPPSGPGAPRIAVAIAPPGPGFIGFNVIEAYGRIHVTLNWCTATLDHATAARIAADFVADPGTCPVDAELWGREPREQIPA